MSQNPPDIVSVDAALTRLVRGGICTEEQLYDYNVSQAMRSVFYAATGIRAGNEASVKGEKRPRTAGVELVVAMARYMLHSEQAAVVMRFLSLHLLCDAASSHGTGNERPCVTREWSSLLGGILLVADSQDNTMKPYDSSAVSIAGHRPNGTIAMPLVVDRRAQLGYLLLVGSTVSLIVNGTIQNVNLSVHFELLTLALLNGFIPAAAALAESKEHVGISSSSSSSAPSTSTSTFQAPTRLTVQANATVVELIGCVATDLLVVDAGGAEQRRSGASKPMVVERNVKIAGCLWKTLSTFGNALQRAVSWIAAEVDDALIASEGRHALLTKDPRLSAKWGTDLLETAVKAAQRLLATLGKQHNDLTFTCDTIQRAMGSTSAKDYHAAKEADWTVTMQLCLTIRTLSDAVANATGGRALGNGAPLLSDMDILVSAAQLLSTTLPAQEEQETERHVFLSQLALASACLSIGLAFPTRATQADFWFMDLRLTEQLHQLLITRALRFRDETVVALAAALSSSIVSSASMSACDDAAMPSSSSSGAPPQRPAPPQSSLSSMLLDAASIDSLFDLLATRDSASQMVVRLLVQVVEERPDSLLPSLFQRLKSSPSEATRKNIIDILEALPVHTSDDHDATGSISNRALDSDPVTTSSIEPTDRRRRSNLRLRVAELLTDHLLLSLHDETLSTRLQGARLFSRVPPSLVVRPLLVLAAQRDSNGRTRGFAMTALQSVIRANVKSASVVLMMLDEALNGALAANQTNLAAPSTTTSNAAADASRESHESQSAAADSTRRVPETPGDILSFAMLHNNPYSSLQAEAATSAQAGSSDRPHPSQQIPPPASSLSSSSSDASTANRIFAVLITTVKDWSEHVLHWTEAEHIAPLFLRFLNSGKSAQSAQSKQRTALEQEWLIKCLAQVCQASGRETASGCRDAILSLMVKIVLPWHAADVVSHTNSESETAQSANRVDVDQNELVGQLWLDVDGNTYKQLAESGNVPFWIAAPLLCLRVCPSAMFSLASGAATQSHTQTLFHSLWIALTNTRYRTIDVSGSETRGEGEGERDSRQNLSLSPELQRVALDVLCKYPASFIIPVLRPYYSQQAAEDVLADRKHTDVGSDDFKYHTTRIAFFCYSALLARDAMVTAGAPGEKCSNEGEVERDPELSVLLNEASQVLNTATSVVLRIERSAPAQQTETIVKVVRAAVDCGALILGASLLHSDMFQAIVDPVTAAIEKGCDRVRSHVDGEAVGEPDSTNVYLQCQIALQMMESSSNVVGGASQQLKNKLANRWFSCFLPLLVKSANMCCVNATQILVGTSQQQQQQSGNPNEKKRHNPSSSSAASAAVSVATQCCNVVFRAVMACRTSSGGPNSTTNSKQSENKEVHSALHALLSQDKEALLSFAIGCTRYGSIPVVQSEGVKLLSALLAVEPELFIDDATNSERVKDRSKSVAFTAASPVAALDQAMAALSNIASMHANPQTRQLAEHVSNLLEDAVRTAATSSSS